MNAYVEFRDNRVGFFIRALARGKHSVSYQLRAEIPGRYSALAGESQRDVRAGVAGEQRRDEAADRGLSNKAADGIGGHYV